MHIEFLVEDSSGKMLLELLIPQIIGPFYSPHTWQIHPYKGIGKTPPNLKSATDAQKRILLDQLPRLLRGYKRTPGIDAVVVVVDSDRKNCQDFLNELRSVAVESGAPDTMFRIAIEEIEAWYLGDPAAIQTAYPRAKQAPLSKYEQDSVCGTWELLADIVYPGGIKAVNKIGWPLPGTLKHEWAGNIGVHMDIERNVSPSFNKFVSGLRRLADI
ncbi:MAG: enolase [Chthonomonadaceae bacterium]|nr:enolase [Chthonomonadaceae bacterium]